MMVARREAEASASHLVEDGAGDLCDPHEALRLRATLYALSAATLLGRRRLPPVGSGIEARLVPRSDQLPLRFGVQAAYEGDDAHVLFGVMGERLQHGDVRSATRPELGEALWSKSLSELDPVLKPEEWHTYTIELQGSVLRAYMDDALVATVGRPRGRDGSYVSLGIQGSIVHVRKVEVTAK